MVPIPSDEKTENTKDRPTEVCEDEPADHVLEVLHSPNEKPEKQNKLTNQETEHLVPTKWDEVQFSFPQPRVKFGKGMLEELPKAIFSLLDPMLMHIKKAAIEQPKLLIVIGGKSLKSSGALDRLLAACERNAIVTLIYSCGSGEATIDMVNEGVQIALDEKPHYIAGIGGGSVIDVAKAIAGIATNGGLVEDYYEGKPFELPGIPLIAVPTTAGTGSEITNNAVLIDKVNGFKKSIRGNQLIAKFILLDPELTLSCPPDISASSGADAFVQAIEAYVSKFSHPLADIYAMEAIVLISRNLKKVFENGQDFAARAEMLLGSYYAGVAFSNVNLGLVHGLAHPIGVKYDIPHGRICGALLPWVIDYNLEWQAKKYANIAKVLSQLDLFNKYEPEGTDYENARRLTGMIKEIFSQVQIPLRLQDIGVLKEDFEWIITQTKGRSVNANPRPIDPESLRQLLDKAW
ncbi:hypothetical protein NEF87_003376 [Candidatus Lokiarchaeum ossiferum]|uniref:Iron-containing alcohol dehydrogenase n=1 Tax=Candidatus Lokiarchaeum ossiferum TaxID=2951803 RepID=A0ABY6HUK6_9ARCH|nr:hypothetical protein NEF87_003376 [Candidatus Lokiarchaeum sp. B-35]